MSFKLTPNFTPLCCANFLDMFYITIEGTGEIFFGNGKQFNVVYSATEVILEVISDS